VIYCCCWPSPVQSRGTQTIFYCQHTLFSQSKESRLVNKKEYMYTYMCLCVSVFVYWGGGGLWLRIGTGGELL
jgi:hypothetical protein